ncbi:Crp/Fnr family transcriptional regulator [bacterium]|nr:Crp/Fnr family transcriptional regulator [bacterium]
MVPDRIWHLSMMSSLKGVAKRDLMALAQAVDESTLRDGESLASATLSERVVFIKMGRLRFERLREEGKPHLLDILGPGEILGQLEGQEEGKDWRVTALGPVHICAIPEARFRNFCSRHPVVLARFYKWTGRRLARVESRLEDLLFKSVAERLPILLGRLAPRIGWVGEEGWVVPLTHQDISRLVGASREATSRALSQLRGEGMVVTGRRELIWKGEVLSPQ